MSTPKTIDPSVRPQYVQKEPLPPGPYRSHCFDCKVEQNTLVCECWDENNKDVYTSRLEDVRELHAPLFTESSLERQNMNAFSKKIYSCGGKLRWGDCDK